MLTTVPEVIARHSTAGSLVDCLRGVAAAAAHVSDWAAATEGRRRTERALQALDRADWQVIRDVRVPRGGHVDHVVVGTGGIYVLASLAWRGVVTVDHKGATITPADDAAAAWTAHGRHRSLAPAAVSVVHGLTAETGRAMPAPRAVVVVWAAFPEQVAVSGGVTYVAGEHLAGWLVGQPRRVDDRPMAASRVRVPVPATGGRRP